ncbi:MAG: putative enoyl-CoA hydratase echA8 [Smithella sp. PtaU1.Bin162]|nr:MAG: putative enoyl-CoA hydratase echA8 [Smithella sp. PtaU1.Bin162]
MNYTTIIVEKRMEEKVGIITLHRPGVRNAINLIMREELMQALTDMENDTDVRAMIVTGGQKIFAAGADIAAMVDNTAIEMFNRASLWDLTLKMEESRKPVIAAIAGFCLGGGCELAMGCDIRIAAESAKFGQPEINVGIIPGAGGTARLAKLVGLSKAKELVLTGNIISAQEALSVDLVNKIVPDDKLLDEAVNMAKMISRHSPVAVGLAKHSVQHASDIDIHTGRVIERACFSLAFSSEDQKEGMRAFLEKRKPNYKGR